MKPVRRFSVSYFFYRFLKKHINHKYIREDSISYTLFAFITDPFHFLSITKINTSSFGIFRDIPHGYDSLSVGSHSDRCQNQRYKTCETEY